MKIRPSTVLLSLLSDAPRAGSDIVTTYEKAYGKLTGDATLYDALNWLNVFGLVDIDGTPTAPMEGRVFTITDTGRKVLAGETLPAAAAQPARTEPATVFDHDTMAVLSFLNVVRTHEDLDASFSDQIVLDSVLGAILRDGLATRQTREVAGEACAFVYQRTDKGTAALVASYRALLVASYRALAAELAPSSTRGENARPSDLRLSILLFLDVERTRVEIDTTFMEEADGPGYTDVFDVDAALDAMLSEGWIARAAAIIEENAGGHYTRTEKGNDVLLKALRTGPLPAANQTKSIADVTTRPTALEQVLLRDCIGTESRLYSADHIFVVDGATVSLEEIMDTVQRMAARQWITLKTNDEGGCVTADVECTALGIAVLARARAAPETGALTVAFEEDAAGGVKVTEAAWVPNTARAAQADVVDEPVVPPRALYSSTRSAADAALEPLDATQPLRVDVTQVEYAPEDDFERDYGAPFEHRVLSLLATPMTHDELLEAYAKINGGRVNRAMFSMAFGRIQRQGVVQTEPRPRAVGELAPPTVFTTSASGLTVLAAVREEADRRDSVERSKSVPRVANQRGEEIDVTERSAGARTIPAVVVTEDREPTLLIGHDGKHAEVNVSLTISGTCDANVAKEAADRFTPPVVAVRVPNVMKEQVEVTRTGPDTWHAVVRYATPREATAALPVRVALAAGETVERVPNELEARILATLIDGEEHEQKSDADWNADGGLAVPYSTFRRAVFQLARDELVAWKYWYPEERGPSRLSVSITEEGREAWARKVPNALELEMLRGLCEFQELSFVAIEVFVQSSGAWREHRGRPLGAEVIAGAAYGMHACGWVGVAYRNLEANRGWIIEIKPEGRAAFEKATRETAEVRARRHALGYRDAVAALRDEGGAPPLVAVPDGSVTVSGVDDEHGRHITGVSVQRPAESMSDTFERVRQARADRFQDAQNRDGEEKEPPVSPGGSPLPATSLAAEMALVQQKADGTLVEARYTGYRRASVWVFWNAGMEESGPVSFRWPECTWDKFGATGVALVSDGRVVGYKQIPFAVTIQRGFAPEVDKLTLPRPKRTGIILSVRDARTVIGVGAVSPLHEALDVKMDIERPRLAAAPLATPPALRAAAVTGSLALSIPGAASELEVDILERLGDRVIACDVFADEYRRARETGGDGVAPWIIDRIESMENMGWIESNLHPMPGSRSTWRTLKRTQAGREAVRLRAIEVDTAIKIAALVKHEPRDLSTLEQCLLGELAAGGKSKGELQSHLERIKGLGAHITPAYQIGKALAALVESGLAVKPGLFIDGAFELTSAGREQVKRSTPPPPPSATEKPLTFAGGDELRRPSQFECQLLSLLEFERAGRDLKTAHEFVTRQNVSGGRFSAALERMERRGWISRRVEEEMNLEGIPQQLFTVTPEGREALSATKGQKHQVGTPPTFREAFGLLAIAFGQVGMAVSGAASNARRKFRNYWAIPLAVAVLFSVGGCRTETPVPTVSVASAPAAATAVLGSTAPTLSLDCLLPDGRHFVARIDGTKPWVTFRTPPTGSPNDSEILGVNVYAWDVLARDRAGQPTVIGAQLLLSNAFANADGTGHCGAVYFRQMTADAGAWGVTYDVRRWQAPYVIGPPPEGGDHLWLSGQCTVRRVALYAKSVGEDRARALLDVVPALDASQVELVDGIAYPALTASQVAILEARDAAKLSTFRKAFAAGTTTDNSVWLRDPRIGFLQPTGNTTIAYEQGGDRIFFPWGWQRTRSTALLMRAWVDAGAERQRIVRNRKDGSRLTTEDFAAAFAAGKGKGARFQPFSIFLTGDAEYFDTQGRHISLPPCFDVPKFNTGNCKREGEVRARRAHDVWHLIRTIGPDYAAARLLHDATARELLFDEANSCRLAYSDIGEPPGGYTSGVPTMLSWMKKPGPGQGVPSFGRGEGWAMTAIGWAASLAGEGNPQLRPTLRTGRELARVRTLAAPPTGIPQRAPYNGIASAWDPIAVGGAAADPTATLAQAFECAIEIGGEGVLGSQTVTPKAQVDAAVRAGRSMYANAACPTKPVPWKYLDVGPLNGPAAAEVARGWNVGGSPWGDSTHVKRTLGWLSLTTADPVFIELLLGGKPIDVRIAEEMKIAMSGDTSGDPDGAAEAAAILQWVRANMPKAPEKKP